MSQSQFESKDRNYYNSIYVDGAYLHERDNSSSNNSSTNSDPSGSNNGMSFSSNSSVHRPERWSLPSFLRRSSHRQQQSLATQQIKTSESYTLNG
jgi:hypothetical protein